MDIGAMVALGFGIGVLVAVPVGPVNVLTIQRSFRFGFVSGLAAGAGSSVADTIFAAVIAFGLTAVSTFVEGHSVVIQIVGGVLVILFGLRILRSHPHLTLDVPTTSTGMVRAFATGFFMTITNPGAMLGFIGLFGALGDIAPGEGDWVGTAELVLGVALGTLAWWTTVAGVVSRVRERFTEGTLARINLVAGTILIGFGGVILGRLALLRLGLI